MCIRDRPKWLDADTASQRLRGSARQNLMVRYVAVLDSTGKALASSDPAGASLLVQLPAGFLESVLEQPVSTLMVSAPVVSFASSEKVLYFARHLRMADSSRVVAVAELPVSALSSVRYRAWTSAVCRSRWSAPPGNCC